MQGLQNKDLVVSQVPQSVQPSPSANSTYDLAIVGSGISCAYTLIHYLSLLQARLTTTEARKSQKTIKVAVLDKSGEFWTWHSLWQQIGTAIPNHHSSQRIFTSA
ncbi:MAG: hypothetical protein HC930_12250 [Hydrococcus sp. SU_1_0]|nr:hypothetical protein [Hydrococcus sp. SU_1_0]